MTLKEMKEYIGADRFKTFENVDDFQDLTATEKQILKEIGIVDSDSVYPYYKTDGKLIEVEAGLIKIGEDKRFAPYSPLCIDINDNRKIVGFDHDKNEKYVVNSNLETYIKCLYIKKKYMQEYEDKEVYGKYFDNDNCKKYVKKFREMLNEVEPDIEKFVVWEDMLSEKELGVI